MNVCDRSGSGLYIRKTRKKKKNLKKKKRKNWRKTQSRTSAWIESDLFFSCVCECVYGRKGRKGWEVGGVREGEGEGRTGRRWTETEQKIEVHVT